MPGKLTVRNARIRDSIDSLPVWREFMAYHRRISSMDFEMIEEAEELWRKYFERHVRSRTRKAIVAEIQGEIVGFLLGEIQKRPPVFITSTQAFVDSIGVLERFRKQGIGTELLKAFTIWAQEKSVAFIMLNVAVENRPAIRCYEKEGFETVILSQRKTL